jgi:hypothetical protein
MDAYFLGLTALFFLLSFGLIAVCDRLHGGGR